MYASYSRTALLMEIRVPIQAITQTIARAKLRAHMEWTLFLSSGDMVCVSVNFVERVARKQLLIAISVWNFVAEACTSVARMSLA